MRMQRVGLLLAVTLVSASCAREETGTGDGPPSDGPQVPGVLPLPPASDTPAGLTQCTEDAECSTLCEDYAAQLRAPSHREDAVGSSRCGPITYIIDNVPGPTTMGCSCELAPGPGSHSVSAASNVECFLQGRVRNCLYAPSDFPGCAPGVAGSCTDVCSDVVARLVRDAAEPKEVQVHGALCRSGACHCAMRVPAGCYLTTRGPVQDCSLSAGELYERSMPDTGD
jgi:hypothetical protein